jgi:hypothetical protein
MKAIFPASYYGLLEGWRRGGESGRDCVGVELVNKPGLKRIELSNALFLLFLA